MLKSGIMPSARGVKIRNRQEGEERFEKGIQNFRISEFGIIP
jgi:hypothetical protein